MELRAHFCVYKSRNWASWIQSTASPSLSYTHTFLFILFSIFQTNISLRISHLSVRISHPVSASVFFTAEQQPPLGQVLLIIKDSRSHSDTPHSVGLLWASDQLVAETSTWQHTTLTWDRQTSMPRRDSHPRSQQASDRRTTTQTARPLGSAILILSSE
jgi:hypothetical protein